MGNAYSKRAYHDLPKDFRVDLDMRIEAASEEARRQFDEVEGSHVIPFAEKDLTFFLGIMEGNGATEAVMYGITNFEYVAQAMLASMGPITVDQLIAQLARLREGK